MNECMDGRILLTFFFAHPYPQLTTPVITAFFPFAQTRGPPESPWQESFFPCLYPAHIMELVMSELEYPVLEIHCWLVITGTWTYIKFFGRLGLPANEGGNHSF